MSGEIRSVAIALETAQDLVGLMGGETSLFLTLGVRILPGMACPHRPG